MGIMVWIIIGIVFLVICIGGAKNRKSSGSRGNPTRIDHPHYLDQIAPRCGSKLPFPQLERKNTASACKQRRF